ncbi:acyl-CoA reductase [Kordia sp. YSTF-M3]|uniref:Acyl-CoA reductase n=1 Tax=Kordia aestuariivivens TaxID=2759037 RepID=A0ABR7QFJ6_9FLAO|nr:acyl-CoA reductase [Kordia aestuariivivens]MBC8757327.1 acyl-CoA reductase [Kordia aestuariivivens]
MALAERINAFVKLGAFLKQFATEHPTQDKTIPFNDVFFDGMLHQLKLTEENNRWFNKENLRFAIGNWTEALQQENLENWTNRYKFDAISPKKVAIIMAGNIPLVGFHDFLSVLISGHDVLVKQSSNDKHVLPFLAKYLEYVDESFKGKITFTDEKLEGFDAVIATGSNNTARYFEYYFKNKPNIIRKNRNSVAILTGNETEAQLIALSDDIFTYFGLGCRSVSKLFVPKGYDFQAFFGGMYSKSEIMNSAKYANNYDYNKAVYLMSLFDILENGFVMIKEDKQYASPIATVFYEYYDDMDSLREKLREDANKIQCIVSDLNVPNEIEFGQTQHPELHDYADGVDTLEFLINLN